MATKTAVKPSGTGLNKKVAGIPAKYLVAGVILVVAYLLYRRYKGSQTTSAGSNATPSTSQAVAPAPQDSTGGGSGGASGGGTGDLGGQQTQQPPPNYYYYLGSPTLPPSGGNTTGPGASESTQPPTSFTNSVTPIAVTPAGQTQYGGYVPAIAAGTTIPVTRSAPYTTRVTANKTGGSATRRQGVITIH